MQSCPFLKNLYGNCSLIRSSFKIERHAKTPLYVYSYGSLYRYETGKPDYILWYSKTKEGILGFYFVVLSTVTALRMLMLEVPSPAVNGESVELRCSFDLENDNLYSIKWYKNNTEFYRYVPKDWPPGQYLPIPGVRVDVSIYSLKLLISCKWQVLSFT